MIRAAFHSTLHNPEANAQVGAFVSRVIWGDERGFSPFCTMAVADGDMLIAGVVYHNCDPDAGVIELSAGAVTKRWMRPHVIRMMFNIPFSLLGCQMCLHRVKASNLTMVSQMRRFGHKEFVVPRGAGRNEDMHVFTLTDDDWRQHRLYLPPASG